jgi:hypothetical protein
MTMSEFDTLRTDLAAFRSEMRDELGKVRTELIDLRTDVTVLRALVDEKPSAATIYQAALAMFGGMFAVMIGTVIMLKTTGLIP